MLKARILEFDRLIMAWRSNETSKWLDAIPGVGPVLATLPRSPASLIQKRSDTSAAC
jgi:hypothetical protein